MTGLRSLGRALGDLSRASEIATILWASGFRWLVAALGLRSCVSLSCRLVCASGMRECPHHVDMESPLPERMRMVLERLGPTFVKLGQALALRPDYVPLAYAEALRGLHAHVAPFPAAEARALVEAELGRPLEELFARFEGEPFAAASLSQVHRAELPDGGAVAVKVQRPGIAKQMERDLELLALLARRLERRRPEALGFRPSAAVAELGDYTRRELDFRREGRTADRLRLALAGDERIVVPRVDRGRSSARVLTMEFVEGRPPAPAGELREAGLDPDALLAAGAEAMVRQILEHGLFHADPHPGNLLFLDGNRVCFLDFGMFGRLSRRDRRRLGFVLWALVDGDYEAVGEQLLGFAELAPGADPDGFREALEEVVEDWYPPSGGSGSLPTLLLRELALGASYRVVFPRELMLVARSLVGLDGTARLVDPERTFSDLARPLEPEIRSILLPGPGQLEDELRRRRFDYLELLAELPDLVPELAGRLRGAPTSGPASAERARLAPRAPLAIAFAAGLLAAGAGMMATRRRRGPP